jgi:hypothetical protein
VSRECFRPVTSQKPNRKGEWFIVRGDAFYIKVYKDAPGGARNIAVKLCQLMNESSEVFNTLEDWKDDPFHPPS